MTADVCVIGGGIVGVATALKVLERRPGADVVLLEKEPALAVHQTGHNSGVVHAGVYYVPGSLKARLCREGARATKEFCVEHGLPCRVPGKLLVATDEREMALMGRLLERARANRLEVEVLDARELVRREPNVTGLGALLVRATAIVDFAAVTAALAERFVASGGSIELRQKVTGVREGPADVAVETGGRRWTARRLVVCAGLQADRLARMAGLATDFQIVPFRGEYYRLRPGLGDVVRHLVYPVPDPGLPFLGVHLTPTVDGGITVGPNAVLSLSRENYRRSVLSGRDVSQYSRFPGMWRVARTHWRTGLREVRNSLWKRGYLRECQKYCPGLAIDDLLPAPAGIRAQAVMRDGTLVHDFLIRETPRTLHFVNAPSPAATSALAIAERLSTRVVAKP